MWYQIFIKNRKWTCNLVEVWQARMALFILSFSWDSHMYNSLQVSIKWITTDPKISLSIINSHFLIKIVFEDTVSKASICNCVILLYFIYLSIFFKNATQFLPVDERPKIQSIWQPRKVSHTRFTWRGHRFPYRSRDTKKLRGTHVQWFCIPSSRGETSGIKWVTLRVEYLYIGSASVCLYVKQCSSIFTDWPDITIVLKDNRNA